MNFIVDSMTNSTKTGSCFFVSYFKNKLSTGLFRPLPSSALNCPIARWLGRYSPRSSRPRETGPADRPSNAKIYTLNSTIINTISKMNRRIVLKFCIRIEEKILRTFSCWHFSEKNVLHGFFWVFLVFSHLSHLWLINHWIKGHFQHEGMPVAAKCTFTKIINSQRSFERFKKFSPRGHPKCRKVPKYFFGLNHFDEIVDLSSRNGPHGLGP